MAGARDFDRAAVGPDGIPPFEVGLIILSFVGTNIQLGLLLHAGMVMTALKLASAIIT